MDRPTNRIDVTTSDDGNGNDTLRCAAHGTDIINHGPCRLCDTCTKCGNPRSEHATWYGQRIQNPLCPGGMGESFSTEID